MNESLQSKISSLEEEYEASRTEEYEELLESELKAKDQELSGLAEKQSAIREDLSHLRSKYTQTEKEIVLLTTRKETLSVQLDRLFKQKRELEVITDHWEQSARVLEFSKQDLEDKLYQAEESAILYKEELDELHSSKAEEVQRLKEKYQEMTQELESLRNPAKVQLLQEALNEALKKQNEFDASLSTIASVQEQQTLRIVACVSKSNHECALRIHKNTIGKDKMFKFDIVIPPNAPEHELLRTVSDFPEKLIRGGKVCVLVYGTTGSGKLDTVNSIFKYLLSQTLALSPGEDARLSCLEVYNERLKDLLRSERPNKQWKEALCKSEMALSADSMPLVEEFVRNREGNSKGHSVFTLSFQNRHAVGQIQVVELAGSEKANPKEEGLKEALSVNKSLFNLLEIVTGIENKQKKLPFKNSLLTQLIEPTLGAEDNSILFILNCSPLESEITESVNTLVVGSRLKTFELAQDLKRNIQNQDVEKAFKLLEKERLEKCDMIRRFEKLQKDANWYCIAIREKDNKLKTLSSKTNTQIKDKHSEVEAMRKLLASEKTKHQELSKQFRNLKANIEKNKKSRTSKNSPYNRPPSAPPLDSIIEITTKIPKPTMSRSKL